jgi:O-antigen/teichoic acid export membrane protein
LTAPPVAADEPDPAAVLDTSDAGGMAIRGGALRIVGYGASVLLSVFGAALMTRHLGPVDYGRYAVVQSVIAIGAGLAESGILNIGVREYAVRTGAARDRMLANLQGMRLALAMAALVVATVFGLAAGYPSVMVAGLALTGAGLVLQTVQQTWGIPLTATLRLGWVTALDLARQAAQVVAIALLVVVGGELLPFFAVPIPVSLVLIALTLPLARGLGPLRASFDRTEWKTLARLIAPYATATAVGSVYVYFAVVLLSLVASGHEIGLFSASFRVFIVLGGVALLVVGSAFPIVARAARDDESRLAYATERLFETSLVAGAWLGLLTALCAPVAIDVVAGSQYHGSIPVLRIQGIAVLGSFLAVTAGYILVALHRSRTLLISSAVGLLASGVITLTLAGSLGAKAGAWGNVAGETTIAVVNIAALRRIPALRLPLRSVPRVALAAVAAGALALIPGLAPLPLGVAASVVFFALLFAFRAIPQELLDAVPRPR